MQKEIEEFLLTAFDSVIAMITRHAVKGNHRIPIQRPRKCLEGSAHMSASSLLVPQSNPSKLPAKALTIFD